MILTKEKEEYVKKYKYHWIIFQKMYEAINLPFDNACVMDPDWSSKHSWTKEQKELFKQWYLDYLWNNKEARQEMIPRLSLKESRKKKIIKESFCWFDMNYGWKDIQIKHIGKRF